MTEPPTAAPVRQRTQRPADPPRHPRHVSSRQPLPARRKSGATMYIGGMFALAAIGVALAFVIGQDNEPEAVEADGAVNVVQKPKPKKKPDQFKTKLAGFLKTHCFDCHGPDEQEGEIAFDEYNSEADIRKDRKTWEKVHKMLSQGLMPPTDYEPIPEKKEVKVVVDYLDDLLFRVECGTDPDPGRVTVRRLNRAEYNNTIRDLLGLQGNWSKDFPSDDVGEGFDNNGDVLSLPPLLMEKYLAAAERIAEKAIVDSPPSERRIVDEDRGGELTPEGGRRIDNGRSIVLSTTGNVRTQFPVPREAEYLLQIEAMADQAGNENAKMQLIVEGKTTRTFEVTGRRQWKTYESKIRLPKGNRTVKVRFSNDFYNPRAKDRTRRDRNLYVQAMVLLKTKDDPLDLTDAHRRIIVARPGKGKTVEQAATEVFKKFCRRAFRRPVEDHEVQKYVRLVKLAMANGDGYERGIQLGLTGVLVSPSFLYRIERSSNPHNAAIAHRVTQHELATRLSYFLWSSMPDNELMRLADAGTLKGAELERQIIRMVKDDKSRSLTTEFASQWLNLRLLDEFNPPRRRYPEYYARRMELKRAMQRETEMLFEHILKNNRPISEFLTADYTFVNEPLAKLYGMRNVRGPKFQMVSLKDNSQRRGVLTHASVLALTSNPTRTSPVKRGKWILENILASAPPEPPADVPLLEETQKENPKLSLREQLKVHRENGTCASCHKTMDPIGLGFENFDLLGRWRTTDGRHKVDPSGELPGDKKFKDHRGLISIIAADRKKFAKALTEKLMVFGLGRGLSYYDRCAIDSIVDAAERDNYRLQTIIKLIAQSRPFGYRRGESKKSAE